MSGIGPASEGTRRHGRGRRAAKIALLALVLLLLLAVGAGVLWRFRPPGRGVGTGVVVSRAPGPPQAAAKGPAAPPPARRAEGGKGAGKRKTADAGVLAETRGDVAVRSGRAGGWEPGNAGRPLAPGDALKTSRDSGAKIRMAGGPGMDVGEKALLVLASGSGGAPGAAAPSLVLRDGEVRIFLGGTGGGTFLVAVPGTDTLVSAEAAGPGSVAEIVIAVVPDGSTAVSVLSGTATVSARGRSEKLGAGTFSTVARGAPPAAREPLPPPPVPVRPADGASLLYGNMPPRIAFSWQAPVKVDGYRFVLARDPQFRRVVLDQRTAAPGVSEGRLEEGTYYWRVGSSKRGAVGSCGPAARLRIDRHADPPDLAVRVAARPDGGYDVLGTTEPGARVYVAGMPVPVGRTGSFACTLTLERSVGLIVVEAVDPLGNVAYRSRVVQGAR